MFLKWISKAARVSCAALVGILVSAGAQAAAKEQLKMAVVPAAGVLPVYVADKKGYFQDEGLEFEMLPINSGPGAATAVVSGSADMGYGGALPIIAARAQGIPFKIVLGGYADQQGVYADTVMLASKKSGIERIEDLNGKTIAINNAGGISDLQVRIKLHRAGISADEVKILAVPFPQMPAALELGNADVVSTVAPFSTTILMKDLGKVIAEGYVQEEDLAKPVPVAGFYATESWVAKHPGTLAKVRRAIDRANQLIKEDPAEAKKILKAQMRLQDDLLEAIDIPPYDTRIDANGVQAIMDAAHLVKILAKPMTADEVLIDDAVAAN
ncbi:ABC transporter substrate-binding protein [Pusillimonas sp.]|uniref:ABC transporter substrate-binding protein n=1 Tax=Pusillimonas sp. TaxID=3040095 RepID=UPI0037C8A61A